MAFVQMPYTPYWKVTNWKSKAFGFIQKSRITKTNLVNKEINSIFARLITYKFRSLDFHWTK